MFIHIRGQTRGKKAIQKPIHICFKLMNFLGGIQNCRSSIELNKQNELQTSHFRALFDIFNFDFYTYNIFQHKDEPVFTPSLYNMADVLEATDVDPLEFVKSCDYEAITNNWGCGFKNTITSEHPLTKSLKTDIGFAGIRCVSSNSERSLPHSALFWVGNHRSLTDFRACTSNSQCATGMLQIIFISFYFIDAIQQVNRVSICKSTLMKIQYDMTWEISNCSFCLKKAQQKSV